MKNEQYLVQVFERTYYGSNFLGEKVVVGKEGIKSYLESHTFIERVIDQVLTYHEYESKYDIIYVKHPNEDGSFDYYE